MGVIGEGGCSGREGGGLVTDRDLGFPMIFSEDFWRETPYPSRLNGI